MLLYVRRKIVWGGDNDYSIIAIIANIFGIKGGWFGKASYPYNGPAWFIGVIIFCYILFYIILKYVKNKKIKVLTLCFLIIDGLCLVNYNLQMPILNREMGRGICCFFLGGFVYYFENFICKMKKEQFFNVISFICMVSLLSIFKYTLNLNELLNYTVTIAFFTFLVLFVLNFNFNEKVIDDFNKISVLSYSIFLNQVLIMEIIFFLSQIVKFIDFYSKTFFIIFFVILFIFSKFTYEIIEKKGKILILKLFKKMEVAYEKRRKNS